MELYVTRSSQILKETGKGMFAAFWKKNVCDCMCGIKDVVNFHQHKLMNIL